MTVNLVRRRVFDDFGAQITALDGAQILLVRFTIARVLVQHVRSTSFDLRVQNSEPQFSRFHLTHESTFAFISTQTSRHQTQGNQTNEHSTRNVLPSVKNVKFVAVNVRQSQTLIRTHQTPLTVALYSSHEFVRYPQTVE